MTESTDQRLVKGARSRQAIARHAADVASVEGLNGLSIGKLATDLGLSKSGIATLFGSKEKLQIAAVEAARQVFIDEVIAPALRAERGTPRLRQLLANWLAYASRPVFPGGCFRVATVAEFDSRPGVVRDAIMQDRHDWLEFLAGEVKSAQRSGDFAGADPELVAFHLDAVLAATNVALRLGDETAAQRAQALLGQIIGPPEVRGTA